MKLLLAPILTVIVLLVAGVLAIWGTLAGIHLFTNAGHQTVRVVRSPEPGMPSAVRVEPLSIVTARYSCGSQSADVTQRVRELIAKDDAVWANPDCLHADPHPYLNKALVIVYTIDGKPVVLSVGENEQVNRARLLKHAQSESNPSIAQTR